MTPQPSRPRVGLVTQLFYGLGSVAYGVKDNGFSALLLLFYNQVLGLPSSRVGLAIMIALVVDSVLDPLVGMVSDNWTSRWGRRHPFMYVAAIPAAVAFYFLWRPPSGLNHDQLFVYLLAMAILVRSLITLYEIPSTALGAELTESYDARTTLFGFRYVFGWWGGLTMTVLALGVLLRPDAAHPIGQLNPAGYASYGAVSGVLMALAIIISAAGTHRFIPFPAKPKGREARSWRDMLSNLAHTFGHPSFLAIMGSSIFSAMAAGLTLALNAYFVTYYWRLSSAQYAGLLSSAYLGSLLAVFLAPALSRRFGKTPATFSIAVLSGIIGPLPIMLRLLGLFPGPGNPLLLPLLFLNTVVTLALSIGANINSTSMIADLAEDIEVRSGRRAEGLLFSASSVIAKSVTGVGIFLSGVLLSFVQFPEKAAPGEVSQAVLTHLVTVYLPVFFLIQSGAVLCLFGYRITRERHAQNLAILEARKLAAAQPGSTSAP
jgi:GPH family glycoside/pentoside/hexuronide:cation symporter